MDEPIYHYYITTLSNYAPDFATTPRSRLVCMTSGARDVLNDDTILNSSFSVDEVKKCIHKLKTNKCPGPDNIINEFLKYSPQNILELYTDIFNVILKCGVVPQQWCIGYIHPLYKNKGDPNDPNNYRGITITSCLGKLFTTLINSRLGKFVEDMELIGPEQAGFRSGYSTVDHIFVLNSLIDFYLFRKKRLYACFIDYKKAFDSIQRQQLWMKLCNLEIQGKLFNVIYDMYTKVKSCVSYGGQCSDFFPCEMGVRQGDNLSPLLFNIFLSDLKSYLVNKYNGLSNIHDIATDIMDDNLVSYLKIYVLLYADDTILLAESPEELQAALNSMNLYCNDWNLKINVSKTKVVIFSRGKIRKHPHFYLGDKLLEICSDYLYLGVKFNYNGKFSKAQQELFDKGNRAMFSILKRSRQLNLPIDLQLHLFNAIVLPTVLYGCEVWAPEDCVLLEKLQLRFCKYILSVNKCTYNNMVYGELGVLPLKVHVKCRALCFWARLITDQKCKLSSLIYKLFYCMLELNIYESKWILYIKDSMIDCGFPGVWNAQHIPNSFECFKEVIKRRLEDQFIQKWSEELFNSGKCTNYRIFKTNFILEKYLLLTAPNIRKSITRFRCRNSKLPIVLGSFCGISRDRRTCTLCHNRFIGDEYHYLFECGHFERDRNFLLSCYFYDRPSTFKMHALFSSENRELLYHLAQLIIIINNVMNGLN